MNMSYNCICNISKRLKHFLDCDTIDDSQNDPMAHVHNMDTKIVHNCVLREAITLGLNHILLRNTNIYETIQMVVDTFLQIFQLLKAKEYLDVDKTSKMVSVMSRDK